MCCLGTIYGESKQKLLNSQSIPSWNKRQPEIVGIWRLILSLTVVLSAGMAVASSITLLYPDAYSSNWYGIVIILIGFTYSGSALAIYCRNQSTEWLIASALQGLSAIILSCYLFWLAQDTSGFRTEKTLLIISAKILICVFYILIIHRSRDGFRFVGLYLGILGIAKECLEIALWLISWAAFSYWGGRITNEILYCVYSTLRVLCGGLNPVLFGLSACFFLGVLLRAPVVFTREYVKGRGCGLPLAACGILFGVVGCGALLQAMMLSVTVSKLYMCKMLVIGLSIIMTVGLELLVAVWSLPDFAKRWKYRIPAKHILRISAITIVGFSVAAGHKSIVVVGVTYSLLWLLGIFAPITKVRLEGTKYGHFMIVLRYFASASAVLLYLFPAIWISWFLQKALYVVICIVAVELFVFAALLEALSLLVSIDTNEAAMLSE